MIEPKLLEIVLKPHLETIAKVLSEFSMDETLVKAIIAKESSGITWKTRLEPTFHYNHLPLNYSKSLNISFDTEIDCQRTSWGLMQVMGCVARERGFDDYLTKLLIPELGIRFGVKHLQYLSKRYSKLSDVIAAYNAGSPIINETTKKYVNQEYVDLTLEYISVIKRMSP